MIHFLTMGRRFALLFVLTMLGVSHAHANETLEFVIYTPDTAEGDRPTSKVVGCDKVNGEQKIRVALTACLQDPELKKSIKLYWKTDADRKKAIGCEKVTESVKPAASLEDLEMSECMRELPYTPKWTFNARGEIDGCVGVARYRGLEFELKDFDDCYEKLATELSTQLIFDLTKNQLSGECLMQTADGKTFAVPRYRHQKCTLQKDLPTTVVFIGRGEMTTENIEFVWIENKGDNCSAVSEKTLKVLGQVPREKCTDSILKRVQGKLEIVGPTGRNRAYTFRKLLLDARTNVQMRAELGAGCVDSINAITQKGGNLGSRHLANAAVPLSSIRFHTGVQDNLFYHWTSSTGLFSLFKLNDLSPEQASARALKENLYEQMFYFLRTRSADMYQFWRRVFYVAEDTQSSAFLGSSLIEFTLNPKSKTLRYDVGVWQAGMDEVAAKHPELAQNCKMKLSWEIPDTFGRVMFSNMFFIVAEDSGISIIDFNQGSRWFQILSSEPFVSMKKIR